MSRSGPLANHSSRSRRPGIRTTAPAPARARDNAAHSRQEPREVGTEHRAEDAAGRKAKAACCLLLLTCGFALLLASGFLLLASGCFWLLLAAFVATVLLLLLLYCWYYLLLPNLAAGRVSSLLWIRLLGRIHTQPQVWGVRCGCGCGRGRGWAEVVGGGCCCCWVWEPRPAKARHRTCLMPCLESTYVCVLHTTMYPPTYRRRVCIRVHTRVVIIVDIGW